MANTLVDLALQAGSYLITNAGLVFLLSEDELLVIIIDNLNITHLAVLASRLLENDLSTLPDFLDFKVSIQTLHLYD